MSAYKVNPLRLISAIVAACFLLQEAALAAPAVPAPSAMTPAPPPMAIGQFIQAPAQLQMPLEHVTVQEIHAGTNGKLIIHIQDAHANLSGQQSLAKALDYLLSKYDLRLVLVEGSARDSSLDEVRKLAPLKEWKIIARRFLYDGIISGEEYLNLTTEHPMKIIGVEYRDLYDEAVKAYAAVVDRRKDILHYLYQAKISLDRLKARMYPQELKDYERRRGTDDGTNGIDFKTGFGELMKLVKLADYPLDELPQIVKLQALMEKESTIEFEKANTEQQAILKSLSVAGADEQVREFTEASRRLRFSQVSQYLLVQKLLKSAEERQVAMDNFPELKAYADYLSEFTELDIEQLMTQMEYLEDKLFEKLLPDDEARKVRAIDRFLGLLGNAYKLQMSSRDFKMFTFNEPDFKTESWLAFLNRQLVDLGFFESLVPYQPYLEDARADFGRFYQLVGDRDTAFVENAKRVMKDQNEDAAVLIAGGYHTAHLTELLKREGTSYIVLTPVVTDTTDHARYEELLLSHLKQQEKQLTASGAASSKKDTGPYRAQNVATTKIPRGVRMAGFTTAGRARMSSASWGVLEQYLGPAASAWLRQFFGDSASKRPELVRTRQGERVVADTDDAAIQEDYEGMVEKSETHILGPEGLLRSTSLGTDAEALRNVERAVSAMESINRTLGNFSFKNYHNHAHYLLVVETLFNILQARRDGQDADPLRVKTAFIAAFLHDYRSTGIIERLDKDGKPVLWNPAYVPDTIQEIRTLRQLSAAPAGLSALDRDKSELIRALNDLLGKDNTQAAWDMIEAEIYATDYPSGLLPVQETAGIENLAIKRSEALLRMASRAAPPANTLIKYQMFRIRRNARRDLLEKWSDEKKVQYQKNPSDHVIQRRIDETYSKAMKRLKRVLGIQTMRIHSLLRVDPQDRRWVLADSVALEKADKSSYYVKLDGWLGRIVAGLLAEGVPASEAGTFPFFAVDELLNRSTLQLVRSLGPDEQSNFLNFLKDSWKAFDSAYFGMEGIPKARKAHQAWLSDDRGEPFASLDAVQARLRANAAPPRMANYAMGDFVGDLKDEVAALAGELLPSINTIRKEMAETIGATYEPVQQSWVAQRIRMNRVISADIPDSPYILIEKDGSSRTLLPSDVDYSAGAFIFTYGHELAHALMNGLSPMRDRLEALIDAHDDNLESIDREMLSEYPDYKEKISKASQEEEYLADQFGALLLGRIEKWMVNTGRSLQDQVLTGSASLKNPPNNASNDLARKLGIKTHPYRADRKRRVDAKYRDLFDEAMEKGKDMTEGGSAEEDGGTFVPTESAALAARMAGTDVMNYFYGVDGKPMRSDKSLCWLLWAEDVFVRAGVADFNALVNFTYTPDFVVGADPSFIDALAIYMKKNHQFSVAQDGTDIENDFKAFKDWLINLAPGEMLLNMNRKLLDRSDERRFEKNQSLIKAAKNQATLMRDQIGAIKKEHAHISNLIQMLNDPKNNDGIMSELLKHKAYQQRLDEYLQKAINALESAVAYYRDEEARHASSPLFMAIPVNRPVPRDVTPVVSAQVVKIIDAVLPDESLMRSVDEKKLTENIDSGIVTTVEDIRRIVSDMYAAIAHLDAMRSIFNAPRMAEIVKTVEVYSKGEAARGEDKVSKVQWYPKNVEFVSLVFPREKGGPEKVGLRDVEGVIQITVSGETDFPADAAIERPGTDIKGMKWSLEVGGKITIGRSSNNLIRLASPNASRSHVEIERMPSGLIEIRNISESNHFQVKQFYPLDVILDELNGVDGAFPGNAIVRINDPDSAEDVKTALQNMGVSVGFSTAVLEALRERFGSIQEVWRLLGTLTLAHYFEPADREGIEALMGDLHRLRGAAGAAFYVENAGGDGILTVRDSAAEAVASKDPERIAQAIQNLRTLRDAVIERLTRNGRFPSGQAKKKTVYRLSEIMRNLETYEPLIAGIKEALAAAQKNGSEDPGPLMIIDDLKPDAVRPGLVAGIQPVAELEFLGQMEMMKDVHFSFVMSREGIVRMHRLIQGMRERGADPRSLVARITQMPMNVPGEGSLDVANFWMATIGALVASEIKARHSGDPDKAIDEFSTFAGTLLGTKIFPRGNNPDAQSAVLNGPENDDAETFATFEKRLDALALAVRKLDELLSALATAARMALTSA